MSSLKDRISSPLEAGTSILDAHHLPPRLTAALEHASTRLARKAQHATLVVARRDYQLPIVPASAAPTPTSPEFSRTPLSTSSSVSSGSLRSGFASTLKQLVRSSSQQALPSPASSLSSRSESAMSNVSSPAFPPAGFESPGPRFGWPLSPSTPIFTPSPMTPSTATSLTSATTIPEEVGSFGMRLIHMGDLTPRMEKSLRLTLSKTEKLFKLGQEWLAPALSPVSCGLTKQLMHKSVLQNEVLFSGEGLTLVSLDRVYSIKSALSSYSKTRSALRLEDAVDELRRYVLANNGAQLTKGEMLRSYDWLSLSDSALLELEDMYQRAYGGPHHVGGISGMPKTAPSGPEPTIVDSDYESDAGVEGVEDVLEIGLALTSTTPDVQPQQARPPLLKLQTTFLTKPKAIRPQPVSAGGAKQDPKTPEPRSDDEDSDRTARPNENVPIMFLPWGGGSIDQVLSPGAVSTRTTSMKLGPTTPNGYDDISPITRGEWGFLRADDAFQAAKQVRVQRW